MGISPRSSIAILSGLLSMQVTVWPVSAKQVPATRPT
jgi:hypothetical protein